MKTLKEGMLLYKVIKAKSRTSAMVPNRSKYALHYKKGSVVASRSKTLGVLCFCELCDAQEFITIHDYFVDTDSGCYEKLKIVKVRALDDPKCIKWVGATYATAGATNQALNKFYRQIARLKRINICTLDVHNAPVGTVACSKVEVLE